MTAEEKSATSLPTLCENPPLSYVQPIAVRGPGGNRVRLAALLSSSESASFVGKQVVVCGWSRSVRKQGGGSLCFVVLSDGSSAANLQVVVNSGVANFADLLKCGAGCSFRFCGLVVESPAKGQKIELQVADPQRGMHACMHACMHAAVAAAVAAVNVAAAAAAVVVAAVAVAVHVAAAAVVAVAVNAAADDDAEGV